MSELHIFGSGKVRIGDVGGALTDSANGIGSIQSITSNVKYDKKELYNTPVVSIFPVDVGFGKGEASVKLEFNDINRDVLGRVTGAAKTTASNVDTYTIGKASAPTKFRLEADMIDTSGKNVKVVVFNCYAVEAPIAAKLDDFASMTLEVFALPDPTTGSIMTVAMDQ